MRQGKRIVMVALAALMLAGSVGQTGWIEARADNEWILTDKIPAGKTGKNMTISFRLKNDSGEDYGKLGIRFDTSGVDIGNEDEDDLTYGYAFPFEVTESTFDEVKSVGSLDSGKSKTVSLTGKVRRDLSEGYYTVPIAVFKMVDGNWHEIALENVRIWISRSSSTTDDDDETNRYGFVLGEGQITPDGTYPNVMNFSVNLRNDSSATVYNVNASMQLDKESTKFPFEINEMSYDRRFDKIEAGEVVSLDYSFAIRKDTYSGYYPIDMKIYYSDSSTGDVLQTADASFYVRIHNKEKEDAMGDFNEHDREKARIIVDGFSTEPETIIAGEEFDLVVRIKNASSAIDASNLLLTMESEKVSDSAVFVTESGSSSIALDSLPAEEIAELRVRLKSKAGVDQRSYGFTIKAKYDSPEYKNAEETMTVDIPVKQIARLNTGTFEVMPDMIEVGDETNIMFPINNTGKVILYNVMVKFEADSVQTVESYVGNIKPGETGNVDCMVSAIAPSEDGKVRVTISYEDENGEVSSEEKELQLFVSEPMPEEDFWDDGIAVDVGVEETGFFAKHRVAVFVGIAAFVGALVVICTVVFKKKRKKKAEAWNEQDETEFEDKED